MTAEPTVRTQRWPSPAAGGWLWLFCFQFFVAEQLARLGWAGHYSMARNYISDLGMVRCDATACSSLYWLMNGSFVLQGLLIFFGALGLRCLLPRGRWISFAIAGVGVLVVGLVPEGTAFPLHLLGAAANFLGGNLGMILLGWVMLRRPTRSRGWVTLLAGVTGMLGTVAIAFSFSPSWAALGWDAGMVERLAAYPLPLWLTWTGLRLVRAR
jgi:hypothetical membrane protein